MRRFVFLVLMLGLNTAFASDEFIVLCYHEVRRDVRDYPDPYAVDDGALAAQFAWLRGNGYTPVSLDDIVTARKGGKSLPAKAVLLTFDDAYLSFHTRVYPLLREFRYPAVLAVVGRWIDAPPGTKGLFGEKDTVTEASFPSWGQLREMVASGLVEIASHSYDLHRGVPANPQGNLQPAATARIYDAASGRYEDDASWRARVRSDLARNAERIEREVGRRPRAIAWPYGSYNDELVSMAADLGSPIALTLDEGANTPRVPLNAMRRVLVAHNPSLAEFGMAVRGPEYPAPVRAVRIRLDDIHSPDPAIQEQNLSALLDRIQVIQPTHVYLQATSDTNVDTVADAAYFPNRHLPMRADLFNRVAWQLATRTDMKVFAVLSGLRLPADAIPGLYEDLARSASFEGLLFEDETVADQPAIVAKVRALRAPMTHARQLQVGPQAARIAHEPDVSGERRRIVHLLRPAPGEELARQMRALQLGGELDFGYALDDFRHDQPPLAAIAPAMSLRMNPRQTGQ